MSPTETAVRNAHDRQCSQCGGILNLTNTGYKHEGTDNGMCRGAEAQKIDPEWKPPIRKCEMELTPEQVLELSVLLGRNVNDRRDLIKAVRNLSTISVDGLALTLEPYLLNRLKSRCHPTEEWGVFLRRVIVEQLNAYAGC